MRHGTVTKVVSSRSAVNLENLILVFLMQGDGLNQKAGNSYRTEI